MLYHFWWVWGDVWRWLGRHVSSCQCRGFIVRGHWSEDPHWHEWKIPFAIFNPSPSSTKLGWVSLNFGKVFQIKFCFPCLLFKYCQFFFEQLHCLLWHIIIFLQRQRQRQTGVQLGLRKHSPPRFYSHSESWYRFDLPPLIQLWLFLCLLSRH